MAHKAMPICLWKGTAGLTSSGGNTGYDVHKLQWLNFAQKQSCPFSTNPPNNNKLSYANVNLACQQQPVHLSGY